MPKPDGGSRSIGVVVVPATQECLVEVVSAMWIDEFERRSARSWELMTVNKAHHYAESVLLNVHIEGIPVETDGDEIVTIRAVNELHRTIALGIVSHAKGIAGEELRFLRTEMGLTQAELSALVHRDKQTIGRWERNEIEIDGSAEALLRRFAIEKLHLPTEAGIDELSRRCVSTADEQPIRIRRMKDLARPYELIEA